MDCSANQPCLGSSSQQITIPNEPNCGTVGCDVLAGLLLQCVGSCSLSKNVVLPVSMANCTSGTFWLDADSDGFGNQATKTTLAYIAPTLPTGYVSNGADCNDNDAGLHTIIGLAPSITLLNANWQSQYIKLLQGPVQQGTWVGLNATHAISKQAGQANWLYIMNFGTGLLDGFGLFPGCPQNSSSLYVTNFPGQYSSLVAANQNGSAISWSYWTFNYTTFACTFQLNITTFNSLSIQNGNGLVTSYALNGNFHTGILGCNTTLCSMNFYSGSAFTFIGGVGVGGSIVSSANYNDNTTTQYIVIGGGSNVVQLIVDNNGVFTGPTTQWTLNSTQFSNVLDIQCLDLDGDGLADCAIIGSTSPLVALIMSAGTPINSSTVIQYIAAGPTSTTVQMFARTATTSVRADTGATVVRPSMLVVLLADGNWMEMSQFLPLQAAPFEGDIGSINYSGSSGASYLTTVPTPNERFAFATLPSLQSPVLDNFVMYETTYDSHDDVLGTHLGYFPAC